MLASGAMKRPAPVGGAMPPAAKARIGKSPAVGAPPLAKAPVAKTPVAKAPVGKAPVGKVAFGKAPVAKAPVAKTPVQPAPQVPKATNGAGTPTAEAAKPSRTDSWKDFENTDPLYALIGKVSQNKIMDADGNLNPERLDQYLELLIVQKVAKKPKDWVEVWAAMDIPVTNQVVALEPILAYGLQHAPETMGKILTELLKGHRIKTKTIQDSVVGAFNGQPDMHGILGELFFSIFPKGPQSEWGWSRVGWSWQEWWKITESCFNNIDKASAFDGLAALLDRIEAEGKTPLAKQTMLWNEKRLTQARALLCKFGDVEDENDLVACIDCTLR